MRLAPGRSSADARPLVLPVAVLVLAMVGFQAGAALAKTLIPVVGAVGTTALRLGFATLMLLAVWRPWRTPPPRRAAWAIIPYGIALGSMNLLFYSSLQTLPLGVAVALEFTGPLGVAIADSRRPVDFLWIALSVFGLLLLLPLKGAQHALQPIGIAYALGAGFFWAMYIVFGRRAGAEHGGQTTALGMLVGSILVVPIGIAQVGGALFAPALLPLAAGVALLSSALPYPMEMYAMTRLPPKTFAVLMSLDPALAALAGLALLGERLNWIQWAAIACVMLASAGSAATGRPGATAAPLPE